MTKEELRQKAIESSKKIVKECGYPCSECTCNGLFSYSGVSCLAAKGYERGFADGVEEGARMASEKQIPKKPIWTRQGFFKKCPTCKAYVDGVYNPNYCGNCGRKLDRKGAEA